MAGRKPYPDAFRVLLVEQVEAGSSRRAAGQRLQVSAATAVRWVQHKAQTGQAALGAVKRRSHASIGYQTPAAYAAHLNVTGRPAAPFGSSTARPVAQPAPGGVTNAETLVLTG